LAEWGLWPGEYTAEELTALVGSYGRRKRFEARLLAVELGRLLGGGNGRDERVPASEMWKMIEELQAP